MKKIAQDPAKLMSMYVNHLRALYMVHQQNHWETSGNNAYGNHLLFQRLYEGVQEMVDEAAEKTIGVYDKLSKGDVTSIVKKYEVELTDDPDAYVKSSLDAEIDFQELAEKAYHALKETSTLTLGVDDMIMSHVSKSEVHSYLLKQAQVD